jgi:predicted DNA-binding protein YlxM (UPF0122 family)
MNIEQLLEAKFTHVLAEIKAQSDLFNAKLEAIHEQTKRTNGRVNEHDDKIEVLTKVQNQCLVKQQDTKIKEVEQKVNNLQNDSAELIFLMKHPKLIKRILVGSVVITLFSFLLVLTTLIVNFKDIMNF